MKRNAACPVVWEGYGAQSPWPDPIYGSLPAQMIYAKNKMITKAHPVFNCLKKRDNM